MIQCVCVCEREIVGTLLLCVRVTGENEKLKNDKLTLRSNGFSQILHGILSTEMQPFSETRVSEKPWLRHKRREYFSNYYLFERKKREKERMTWNKPWKFERIVWDSIAVPEMLPFISRLDFQLVQQRKNLFSLSPFKGENTEGKNNKVNKQ